MKKVLSLILTLGAAFSSLAYAFTTRGYYWIDDNAPVEFTEPTADIPVANLIDGWHSIGIVAHTSYGKYSVPYSTTFLKVFAPNGAELKTIALIDGIKSIDTSLVSIGNGEYICEPDMSGVSPGIHNLQMLLLSPTGSSSKIMDVWFFRIPTDSELSITSVAYYVDGRHVNQQPLSRSDVTYLANLETQDLSSGLHSIDLALVLSDGSMTPYVSAWFYKTPVPAGIVSYEYWFDDNIESRMKTEFDEPSKDLNIISMVAIPDLPFDSRQYEFDLNNGEPRMFGKHNLRTRFYESDGRPTLKTSDFADSRNPLSVTPSVLQEGRTEIARRNDNEIKWYKFHGEIGDSIVLGLTRAAMYELYSPSGNMLLRKKGAQTEAETSLTLQETGKYYLAAHDVVNDRTAPFGINFQHIPRNAILSVSPGTSTTDSKFILFDLFGNGMNDVHSFAIESANGVRFETDSVFAMDNYHLSSVIVPADSIPAGVYDVSVTITDAISGEEAVVTKHNAVDFTSSGALSDINVTVTPSRKAATPYMVDITVSNDSDIPCWGIPVNIACERNHGKNGFVFYMSDFLGKPMTASNIAWYESDNILGTGTDGVFFPVTLAYLHPHETRTLKVGIIAEPHDHIGLYAWAGRPYSEESRQLLSIPADSLNAMPVPYTNIFDLRTAAYVASVLDEAILNSPLENSPRRSKAKDNMPLEIAREYGPDIVGRYKPLSRPANYADQVGKIAEGYGRTQAGIVNSGAGYHCYMYFKNEEHIPGNTLGEQIANIEAMYPGAPESIPPGALQIYYQQAKKTLGRGSSPQEIAEDVFAPDWYELAKLFICRNGDSNNPMPTRHDIEVYMSGDPNNMTGYVDPSGGNAVGCHIKTLDYAIEFENDPQLATVPASGITVTNTLDANVFDLSSFRPQELRIGSFRMDLPAEHHFVRTVDMRPGRQCIAEVRLDFSTETGKAEWTLTSLDPMTLEPITDAREGLLPVNDDSGKGIGIIEYNIALRTGLAHGTSISNKASIIFDDNDAIETPEWVNITDYEYPSATIVGDQPYDGSAYQISVELKDEGSGVMSYDLYVKTDTNDSWRVIKSGLTGNQIQFDSSEPIPGISFMALATDKAGNRQTSTNDSSTSIITTESDNDDELWYDLQGRRSVMRNGNAKGIMISTKGRKIVVK